MEFDTMQTGNLFTRHDTILGVCEGLGQDLGVSGNWFRVALAGGLFFNPVAAVAVYFAAGLVVLASRMIFPNRQAAVAADATVAVSAPVQAQANDDRVEELALAA